MGSHEAIFEQHSSAMVRKKAEVRFHLWPFANPGPAGQAKG